MPRQTAPLSARRVDTVKPGDKPTKLFDGGGLFLLVTPSGGKLWRLKYLFDGKEKTLALGKYPYVTLEMARKGRQDAREHLAQGIDPSTLKEKAGRAAIVTVESVAHDWIKVAAANWTEGHTHTVRSRMNKYVIPPLGNRHITEITARDIMEVLRQIEASGLYDTAHRIRSLFEQIFTYAMITGVEGVTGNPAAGLSRALRNPPTKHMSAILDPKELSRLLLDIDGYPGSFTVRCALKLAPMLFVRPGELRKMQWEHIDIEAALWTIPAEEMKMRKPHIVPLPKQALAVLGELRQHTMERKYVFSGRQRTRPMSENTVNMALRTMGWGPEKVTGHGFRATARTMLHETLNFSPDAIEAQLAHAVLDRLGSAYNRAQHLEERTRMMQTWADYLDGLKA